MINPRDLTVVIPAHNEERTIAHVVQRTHATVPGSLVVVVDDGSRDGTVDAAAAAGAHVIRLPSRQGNGAAVRAGLNQIQTPFGVLIDGDGEHLPEEIPKLLAALEGHVMATGARPFWPPRSWRGVANLALSRLASWIAGCEIADLTSGFRAFRTDAITPFVSGLPQGYSYATTMTLALATHKERMVWVPISQAPPAPVKRREGVGPSSLPGIQDVRRVLGILGVLGHAAKNVVRSRWGEARGDALWSGTVWLTVAKLVFVAANYLMYVALARRLGPGSFGQFGLIVGAISILNMAFVTGTLQTVSHATARLPLPVQQAGRAAWAINRQMRQLQVGVVFVIVGGFVAFAPGIAGWFKDDALTHGLRLAAIIPLCYAFYAIQMGSLNGLKAFRRQAGFDISFSCLKVALVVGGVWAGWQVLGAIGGFAVAALLITLAAYLARQPIQDRSVGEVGEGSRPISSVALLRFYGSVAGWVLVMQLLITLDLFMLKRLAPMDVANPWAGWYTAIQTIARVPTMLLAGMNLAIFPIVSSDLAAARVPDLQRRIRQGLRWCLLVAGGWAVLVALFARPLVAVIYSPAYLGGVPALRLLGLGYLAWSCFLLYSTLLSAAGRPQIAMAIAIGMVGCDAWLNARWIPGYGLVGAAMASTVTFALGAIAAFSYVQWDLLRRTACARSG